MASYHDIDIDTRCNKVMELRNKKSVTPPTVDTSMEDDQAVSVRLLSNNVIRIEIRAESIKSY